MALRSLKIKNGDEVIVTPRSYFSSASSIINVNAKPIFADINLNSHNISVKSIEKKITNKTRAIICVHLGGYPCEMRKILKLHKSKKNICY